MKKKEIHEGILDVLTEHGIKIEQFESMFIIPHNYLGNIFKEAGAKFKKLPTWVEVYNNDTGDADKLMRYVLYMYDGGSPMMSIFPDLDKRMDVCFELAGLSSRPHRTEIKKGKLSVVTMMTYELLKTQNNMLWNLIVTNESMFYENMKVIMEDVTAEKDKDLVSALKVKHDLAVSMDKTHARLTKYLNQFYRGDSSMVAKHNIISSRISSESVADRMSKN